MESVLSALSARLEAVKQRSIEEAVAGLQETLEELAGEGLAAAELVPLLELIRSALPGEINRLSKAWYADRPLPLAPPERAMLSGMHSLFGNLSDLYWMCCQQFEREPASESEARNLNLAGTLQRCVHALVSRMIEDFRARQVIDPGRWLELHRIIDKAAGLGLNTLAVPDPLNPSGSSAVNTTYGRAVLLASAQAGAMTPRTLDATLALTGVLEPFIDCSWQAGQAVAETSSVQATGRLRVLRAAGMTHLLNNTRLAGALLSCSQKLSAGEAVASLDVLPISRSEVAGLLARLHRVWCGTGEIRSAQRTRSDEKAVVGSGFYAIYRLLSGKSFAIPHPFHVYLTNIRPGQGAADKRAELADTGEAAAWRILDRSGEGLRAARPPGEARLTRGFLMGISVEAQGKPVEFSLGEVRWVQEDAASPEPSISAGIKLLPGKVRHGIMCARGGKDGAMYQEVVPVFMLDQSAAPKLIVPNGWWQADRTVDVWHENQVWQYTMGEQILRTVDFEAGRYTVVAPARR